MNDRNPLMDPERGEVFRRGRETRYVFGCEEVCGQPGVHYSTPAMQRRRIVSWVCIEDWQRWASKAKLVEQPK